MTPGIVGKGGAEAGGADGTVSGPTVGIGTVVANGSVVGSAMRVGIGASSGRTVITGSVASGEAKGGGASTGAMAGAIVGAAWGDAAALVHATDAMSAMATIRRMPQTPHRRTGK
jgi:hypothetical protein